MKTSSRLLTTVICSLVMTTYASAESIEIPTWLLHTKFSGDFRYRHETIDFDELSGDSTRSFTRNRHRIRLRVGLISSPSDYTTVGFRLVSGRTSARSTNEDLSGSFSTKEFMLDRAYIDLHPSDQVKFIMGKAAVPFEHTSQLVWDSDVNLEGMTSILSGKLTSYETSIIMGGYWLQEYKREDDQGLLGIQGSVSKETNDLEWTASITYLDYQKAARGAVFGSADGNTQMSQGTEGTLLPYYVHDYDLLTFSGIATLPFSKSTKVSLYFEAVENTAIGIDRHGILGGLKTSTKISGLPCKFGYSYRDIDSDATIAALMDSDFADGQSNSKGHEFNISVKPLKELSFGATAFLNEYSWLGKDLNYSRFMADVSVKF